VREVARATSAAPTYFEPALPESLDTIPNAMPMVDGGVFANNPAACALVEALKMKLEPAVKMQDVVVLSLGTGRRSTSISYRECKDWGLVSWARPLVNIFMEGVSQTVDYQLKTVFTSMGIAPQYVRIDGAFDDIAARLSIEGLDPAMDHASPENMGLLQNFGRQLAMNSRDTLRQFAESYCTQSPGKAWST
jgi:patatin-like phospholipase/acyl hydrolase